MLMYETSKILAVRSESAEESHEKPTTSIACMKKTRSLFPAEPQQLLCAYSTIPVLGGFSVACWLPCCLLFLLRGRLVLRDENLLIVVLVVQVVEFAPTALAV